MKWYTTETKPSYDKYIIVVHNIYVAGKTELCTTTGILKVMSDNGWTVLSRNTGMGNFIPLTDIHGWCLECSIANKGFNDVHRNIPIEMICPHCGESVLVNANAIQLNWMDMPVVRDALIGDRLFLNWDDIDAECDFEYICGDCEGVIAHSLEELQELYDKQQKKPVKDFTDDADKMLDFFLLSKEQFLESYSYITEEEWNNTLERVKKEWMPNRKKGN